MRCEEDAVFQSEAAGTCSEEKSEACFPMTVFNSTLWLVLNSGSREEEVHGARHQKPLNALYLHCSS